MADIIRELREKITIAREHERWEEVRDLAQEMVSRTSGSGFALRALVQACEHLGETEPLPEAWTALVEEAREVLPFAGSLAAHHLAVGHRKRAIHYYELAIEAAIESREYEQVETYWLELADAAPERLSRFAAFAAALRQRKQHDLAANLLSLLQAHYDEHGTDEERLILARELAASQPDDPGARRGLVEAYRGFYRAHANLDKVLEHSGIERGRPLEEAIAEIEREIHFDQDECAFHAGWGVGVIRKLDVDRGEIAIDFDDKRGHVMSLEMAEKTLRSLDRDDFRSLLRTRRDDLPRRAQEEPLALVHAVLKACDGPASAKQIKEHLLDTAVPRRGWTSWWASVSEQLKSDPYVELQGAGAARKFALREHPVSPSEEVVARFHATANLAERVAVLRQYATEMPAGLRDDEALQQMVDALAGEVGARPAAGRSLAGQVLVVLSLPEIAELTEVRPSTEIPELASLVPADPEAALAVLEALERPEHRLRWAEAFRDRMGEAWADYVRRAFPAAGHEARDVLARYLEPEVRDRMLTELFAQSQRAQQTNPGLFLWLARGILATPEAPPWAPTASDDLMLEQVFRMLDYAAYRSRMASAAETKAAMRGHVSAARRIVKAGGYAAVRRVLRAASYNRAARFLATFKEVPGLDDQTRKDLVRIAYEIHPELASADAAAAEAAVSAAGDGPVQCTRAAYGAKQARARHIKEVEIPKNAKEIETAREHGDLRENAEYHAARDQRKVLQAELSDLQKLLQTAEVVGPMEVDTTRVGFGTRLALRPLEGGADETLTILGPWESAPEQKVLSYLSPAVQPFLGAGVGDTISLREGEASREFVIVEIANALEETVEVHTEGAPPMEPDAS